MSQNPVVTGITGNDTQGRDAPRRRLRRAGHAVAIAMAMVLAGQPSHATISPVPLIIQNRVTPNFTFILDDSGSMQWAFLQRSGAPATGFTNYVVPRPSGLYGGADYANQVPTFDDSNVHNLITRSSDNNAVYYNPDVVYSPWANSDGTGMSAADPTDALYNPDLPGLGGLDLTVQQTQTATWFDDGGTGDPSSGFCAPCGGNSTFWPITYYVYDESSDTDGDRLDSTDYTKYQVQGSTIYEDGTATTTIPAPANADTDDWTAAEVKQNFANWFQYTRSRILAARSGIGLAFAGLGTDIRLAYGAINVNGNTIDGVDTDTLVRGMRDFSGQDREDFFDFLYGHTINTSGTPLRTALHDAGIYHERTDGQGPWNTDPSSVNNGEDLECQQSFAILTTDGFWNGAAPNMKDNSNANVNNTDGTDGENIVNPNGNDFQYIAGDPYEDSFDNTLADVAMNFWRRDLRTDLDNKVPVSTPDPAFWQHMATFGVAFGLTGTLDPDNDLPDLTSGAIEWPDPTDTQDAERIDDLWHAGVNSRGGFAAAGDPQTLAKEVTELIDNANARTTGSAAAVATNSGQIDTDTRLYQARFDSNRWSGDLYAFRLTSNGQIDANSNDDIIDDAIWNAAERIPDASNRNIVTYDAPNADGVDFEWASLNTGQQLALNTDIDGNVDSQGQDRLAYVRGDYSLELQHGGPYRNRSLLSADESNLLGDIVNSSPFLDTKRNLGFSVLSGTEGDEYTDYRNSNAYKDRPDMIYVGANDGMLHAFNAGDPETSNIDTNEGVEEFAFVPNAVFENLSDLTSPTYNHRYYVDESPRMVDVYIDHDNDGSKSWRSVLIGSTGAGGKSVFALDVTDPENFTASNVLWEFTDPDLGYAIGRPTIARFPDGNFYAIFGDGYDNTTIDGSGNTVVDGEGSATAQLFIVDLEDGSIEAQIDTGVGTDADPNGLSSVIPIDTNNDRIIESIFAGDLEGNLWKFDVSSSNTSQWDVANISGGGGGGGGGGATPLFTAEGPNGEVQPIVVRPEAALNPDDGVLTIYFGTGQAFETGDLTLGANPDVQSIYAIRDEGSHVDRSDLLAQQITSETTASGLEFRIISDNSPSSNGDDGWYFDLIVQGGTADGERVTTEGIVRGERAIFVSQVPSDDPCDFTGSSWLYEVNAFTGARLAESVFDTNQDGKIDSNDDNHSAIRKGDLLTFPTILDAAGGSELKFMSTASGGIDIQKESDSIDEDYGRGSWREIR